MRVKVAQPQKEPPVSTARAVERLTPRVSENRVRRRE
jgi:hypothetical protein